MTETFKQKGDKGELDVVQKVPCPNCGKALTTLPKSYPLFDLQCEGCSFRVQVKTTTKKPGGVILGAGWDVIDKVTKAGFMVPPLIVNYRWTEGSSEMQQIAFYPFVPKKNLRKRVISETAQRANYRMFNYVGLAELPHFVLYSAG